MIKRIVACCAVLVLAAGLTAGPAFGKNLCAPGKNGAKGCKNEIAACITATACSAKKGKDKRSCKKACKTTVVNACKVNTTVCSASPSGAFIDSVD